MEIIERDISKKNVKSLEKHLQEISPKIRKRDPYNLYGNPHCIGRYINEMTRYPPINDKIKIKVEDEDPETEFKSQKQFIFNTQQHQGQRKLLLSEIQFLSKFGNADTIIYPGAAPGNHIVFLTKMFPHFKWILIDPAPFNPKLSNNENITIINGYMTDEMCEEFRELYPSSILISDIRSIDTSSFENLLNDEVQVFSDMIMQQNWVLTLQPIACSLKFRFPFEDIVLQPNGELTEYFSKRIEEMKEKYNIPFITDGKYYEYLNGDMMIQAFPPKYSTETRLFASRPYEMMTYNSKSYERKLAYYNQNIRTEMHHQKEIYLRRDIGLDCCNDCCLETMILEEYFKNNREIAISLTGKDKMEEAVISLSIKISKNLNKSPGNLDLVGKERKFADIKHREFAPNRGEIS